MTPSIQSALAATPGTRNACTSCKHVQLIPFRQSQHRPRGTNTPPRNPTLSYTQRLEQKVTKLEEALQQARRHSHDSFDPGLEQSFSDYRPRSEHPVDATAPLPLDDSISLFKLPGSVRALTIQKAQADLEVAANKETLVNSAWRERVFERLADTPVR